LIPRDTVEVAKGGMDDEITIGSVGLARVTVGAPRLASPYAPKCIFLLCGDARYDVRTCADLTFINE